MALFDALKKKKDAVEAPKKVAKEKAAPKAEKKSVAKNENVPAAAASQGSVNLAQIIREPRITEKATMLSERGAYVFDVDSRATKPLVAQAIKAKYGVTPKKVHMIAIPAKRQQSRTTGVTHTVGGGRKAVVYLKKGDKIEFV
jgi:large subunit ribosomal protein L23